MYVCRNYLSGRQFGNAFFRYIHARIFAEIHSLKILTDFTYPDFLNITPQSGGDVFTNPVIYHEDDNKYILDKQSKRIEAKHIFSAGNWENPKYYVEHTDLIRRIATPTIPIEEVNRKDIVIHLRLGDFPVEKQIHPSWYTGILREEKFDKLYIVTDLSNIDPSPIPSPFLRYSEYMQYFSEFSPIIIGSDRVSDWNFIRKFSRIVMSNGTYCWWAVFFSKFEKAYSFKGWKLSGFPGLTVVDGKLNGEA
jgi:hypothetical protein